MHRRTPAAVLVALLSLLFAGLLAGSASAATGSLSLPKSSDAVTDAVPGERGAERAAPQAGALAGAEAGTEATYEFSFSQSCSASGGQYGFGYAQAATRQLERGFSGTQQFRVVYRGQILANGRWNTVETAQRVSARFANDGRSLVYTTPVTRFSFEPRFNGRFGRLQVTMQWLSGSGRIIAAATRNTCAAEV